MHCYFELVIYVTRFVFMDLIGQNVNIREILHLFLVYIQHNIPKFLESRQFLKVHMI